MSFYLVMIEQTFQVVSENDYVNGNILNSGDFSTMDKMLKQLQQCSVLNLEKIDCDTVVAMLEQSPLLKLTRSVEVTQSGNTKYSLSDNETDPYADVELSEDEYRPSHHSESSDSSTDHSIEGPASIIRESVEQVCSRSKLKVQRRLFEDNNEDGKSTASASTSYTIDGDGVESNPFGVTLAVVTVAHSKVEIDVMSPIHAGKYVVPLFLKAQQNDEVLLQGYIMKKKVENHHCITDFYETSNVPFCDTIRNENTLTCNLELCCPKGVLVGYEKFIIETKNRISILTYKSLAEVERENGETITSIVQPLLLSKTPSEQSTKLRQHACLFCGELKTCIARHIQTVHCEKEEVKKLKDLKGQEKAKALRSIRYMGDKKYNEKVAREKRIPVRKPVLQLVSECVHCPSCSGLIGRRNFGKHHLRCSKRQPDRLKRIHQFEFEELKKSSANLDTKILQELLKDLQDDEVASVIRNDKLIQGLGIYMSKSNRSMHQMKNSRAQMRRCARLLLIIRKMDPSVHDFKDCMVSSKYGLIMNATRVLCKETEDSRKFASLKYPTVALQVGPMISTLISRLRRFYLEHENLSVTSPEVQALESFSALHRSEFSIEITRDALTTANTNRFNAKKELPTPADIQKLRDYCQKVFEETYSYLEKAFDFAKWKLLGEVLLCQIMIFNRRRPGEISRTLLDDYKNKKKVDKEQYQALSRLEMICADFFTMIYIQAKRGRNLGILLQPENIKGLDMFISLREKAQIPPTNPYLFAFGEDGYLCASSALSSFTNACGAENPDSLTGTDLRKHAATMCQLFNLNENQLKQMADFMGHTFDVHLNHYRMPEQTTQIVNISRFLAVVGDKDVYSHRGKSWDELQLAIPAPGAKNKNSDGDDENNASDRESELEIGFRDQNSANETHVFPRNEELEEAKTVPETKSPKRRRVVPRRFRDSTPQKSRQNQHVKHITSPNSIQLLNILANPSNRQKASMVKHEKRRWNSKEINFMKEKFAEFLDSRKPLPKIKYVNMVLQQNREVFQEGRSGCSLYCWIQNQRAKT